jgi:uncharacterized membrane protein YgcG
VSTRPRRYTSPTTLRLGTAVFDYDLPGLAYRLRVVGDHLEPVLRPDRRLTAAGDARIGRRSTDAPGPSTSPFEGPSEGRQLAVIGAVTLLAVLIGFGVTLIPSNGPTRAAAAPTRAVSHSVGHHSSPATTATQPAATAPAHRSHAARAADRHHHHAATVGQRHAPAAHPRAHTNRAPAKTPTTAATAPTTTTPVETTSTPITTTTAPVQTTPPPTHTTPAPTHTTPAPTHTTPSGTGSSGTSGSSSAGTSSSGSSSGSGPVSGGG